MDLICPKGYKLLVHPLLALCFVAFYSAGAALSLPKLDQTNSLSANSAAKIVKAEPHRESGPAAPTLLVMDGKQAFREDFDLSNPFERAKVRGFYAYAIEDTYQSGVVGTWGISEVGQIKEDGVWQAYNFTHIWDFRLDEIGEYTMSWVIYRGDQNANPFDLNAMDLWQRIEGRWRVGWRQLDQDAPIFPVVASVFERSQVWKNKDVGQWAPTHDNTGPWAWVMKYNLEEEYMELGVARPNGPDLSFQVTPIAALGGSALPENFLIQNDPKVPSAFLTLINETSWGSLKEKLIEDHK